jgi:hypothetical protein
MARAMLCGLTACSWMVLTPFWEPNAQCLAQDPIESEPLNPTPEAPEESEPETLDGDDVRDLLDQLDGNKLQQRNAAEKRLSRSSAETLKFLPEDNSGLSIEASERLDRVRKALRAKRTSAEAKLPRIRFKANTTLGEALEAISAESGVEFEHDFDESMPITATVAPLGFWNALDLVLDQADLDVDLYSGDGTTMTLRKRAPGRPPRSETAAYSGVYRLAVQSVTSRRVIADPLQSSMNVSLSIAWLPGKTPIGLTIPMAQLNGRLDDGQPLQAQSPDESIEVAANPQLNYSEFFLPCNLPEKGATKISSLTGTIDSLLPGEKHDFELPLNQIGQGETKDAVTVTLENVYKNGDLTEVRFSVKIAEADKSLESHRQWIFQNQAMLVDADGKQIEDFGYELYRQTEDSVAFGYLFDVQNIQDCKLVYRSPTSVIKSRVEFVLQDVPLP